MDVFEKLKSFLPNQFAGNTNDGTNGESNNSDDPNVIDIKKAFSSDGVNIVPIIKKVLALSANFPNDVLHTPAGHKYNELEIFQTNLDSNVDIRHKSFFDNFNRTNTELGKHLLQSILLQPTTDIKLLSSRQGIIRSIKKLSRDDKVKIKKWLQECQQLEKDLMAMQIEDTPEMLEVYKVIFFELPILKELNYNEHFLKLFFYFIIIFSPVYGIVAPFTVLLMPFFFMKYVLKVPITFDMFYSIVKNMVLGGTGFFTNINKLLNSGAGKVIENMVGGGSEGGMNMKSVIINIAKWFVAFMSSSAGTYIYIAFLAVSYCYNIYNTVQVSITYNKIINMFHSRLIIISKWLNIVRNMISMGLGVDCQMKEMKEVINQIKTIFATNSTVASLLDHSTFNNEPGLFSNKGIIIKTFREFLDNKTLLEPFCKYIAYIDTWYGVSCWLDEGTRSMCTYIMDSSKPVVSGQGISNICCNVPVVNDVQLGIDKWDSAGKVDDGTGKDDSVIEGFNNMLITGPNGSGKSTYIKGVIECILLGQTVGVVPARVFELTPFKHISTYLNIPDCQGKESLFQAEMNRCYQQLEKLKEAEAKGEFSFSIMDEIFVSTNYQEGMSGAYAIIKRMCNMGNCLNIITTHFDVLAGMDEMHVCKKYFDIEMEGELVKKDYKIRDGVSKKHMALKLLKQKGFDADIIADAEYLYNKLQSSNSGDSGEDIEENDNNNDNNDNSVDNSLDIDINEKVDVKDSLDIVVKEDIKEDAKLDTKLDEEISDVLELKE